MEGCSCIFQIISWITPVGNGYPIGYPTDYPTGYPTIKSPNNNFFNFLKSLFCFFLWFSNVKASKMKSTGEVSSYKLIGVVEEAATQ